MKSMNKSFLGASIILAVLSGCASKQAQQPELTLSGLNPANLRSQLRMPNLSNFIL